MSEDPGYEQLHGFGKIPVISFLKKTFRWLQRDTLKGSLRKIRQILRYMLFRWMVLYLRKRYPPKAEVVIPSSGKPFFSLLCVAYRTPAPWLRKAVNSVREQYFPDWELCIGLCEITPDLERDLREIASVDGRIRLFDLGKNLGISGNTNVLADRATGEFMGVLDHDDYLEPHAFAEMFPAAVSGKFDLIYSDEDLVTADGRMLLPPNIKPDWAPETHLSYGYICHLCFFRRSLFTEVGGYRSEYDNAQDYDLFLRITEKTRRILHIPKVLYHWRRHALSSTSGSSAKPGAWDASMRAVKSHLSRIGDDARVEQGDIFGVVRVRYRLQDSSIDVIIPSLKGGNNLARCLDSILRFGSHPRCRITVILPEDAGLNFPRSSPKYKDVIFRDYMGPVNLSRMNNVAAANCRSEVLLFLSDQTEVLQEDWLEGLLEQIQRPKIGAVGPLLISPKGLIKHAGFTVDEESVRENFYEGSRQECGDYYFHNRVLRNVTSVSGACLCTGRETFLEMNGFDERISVAFYDVDYCLRLLQNGYRIVYTPYVRLLYTETAPPQSEWDSSKRIMLEKWKGNLRDHYFDTTLFKPKSNLRRLAVEYLKPPAAIPADPLREIRILETMEK